MKPLKNLVEKKDIYTIVFLIILRVNINKGYVKLKDEKAFKEKKSTS
jgi:hypothetical protein